MKTNLCLLAILVSAVALGVGCTASLKTRVEVYSPPIRLADLQTKLEYAKDNGSEDTYGAKKLKQQCALLGAGIAKEKVKAHADDNVLNISQVIRGINAYEDIAQQFANHINAYAKAYVSDTDIKHDLADRADEITATIKKQSETARKKLKDIRSIYEKKGEDGTLLNEGVDNVLDEYLQAFDDALQLTESGNNEYLSQEVQCAYAAVENQKLLLPQPLAASMGKTEATVSEIRKAILCGSAGVVRPDIIIETYTDPLLTFALKDRHGWKSVTPPAGTLTKSDGRTDIVIVRDGQFSFSVKKFHNNPTDVIKTRLRIAESTAKVIAEMAAISAGLPTAGSLPLTQSSSSSPSDSASAAAALISEPAGSTVPAESLRKLSEARKLLSSVPAKDDSQEKKDEWIRKVVECIQAQE